MKIAIVGCGYVADKYMYTLANHPELEVTGVFDRRPERTDSFSSHFSVGAYGSMDDLLADDSVEIVLNLTNPRNHYEISKACLNANKHVYSEKPLSMDLDEAKELVKIAKSKNLQISSAPCNVLSESAQTVWKVLRQNKVGPVLLVYAEMDGGLVHKGNYRNYISPSGAPWPAKDEFEVGCTFEHAGYYLTWLATFFGPAKRVTSFSSCIIKNKQTDIALDTNAPDFSVGCIEFSSGIIARLTNSIVAPKDHHLRIIGEDGVIYVKDSWDYGSPVHIHQPGGKPAKIERRLEQHLGIGLNLSPKYPLIRKPTFKPPWPKGWSKDNYMDFSRGVAEMADSIREGRPSRLSAELALHITELTLALQFPEHLGSRRHIESSFEAPIPMPWAQ